MHPLLKIWRYLRKTKIVLPYDPVIPLLGIYPGSTIIKKGTCTSNFMAALSKIVKMWKKPSAEEWMKKHTVEYYLAIERN